jgi:type IV fimbrial biogenesis protein FimT
MGSMRAMKKRIRGFTLMELMVVLAIAGIIIGLGAPNFNRFRLNSRLTNSANDMLASLSNSRTEAIKTQGIISLCASDNSGEEGSSCTDGSDKGWIAFRDTNGDCVRDDGEAVVTNGQFDHSFTSQPLYVKRNGDCVSFSPTGFTRTATGVAMMSHMLICDKRGILPLAEAGSLSSGRGIVVERTGRSRITRTITGGLSDDLNEWADMAGVELECP